MTKLRQGTCHEEKGGFGVRRRGRGEGKGGEGGTQRGEGEGRKKETKNKTHQQVVPPPGGGDPCGAVDKVPPLF